MEDESHSSGPWVLRDLAQLRARGCGCGVVHVAFGPLELRLTIDAAEDLAFTLQTVAAEMRHRTGQIRGAAGPVGRVIRAEFPRKE